MHRGLDCLLLLWWIVTTLTVVLGWPINQPNAQQPTEIVASQYHSSSPALCNDSRCSCTSHSASQHAGLTHVNCQCTPQDQVYGSFRQQHVILSIEVLLIIIIFVKKDCESIPLNKSRGGGLRVYRETGNFQE